MTHEIPLPTPNCRDQHVIKSYPDEVLFPDYSDYFKDWTLITINSNHGHRQYTTGYQRMGRSRLGKRGQIWGDIKELKINK